MNAKIKTLRNHWAAMGNGKIFAHIPLTVAGKLKMEYYKCGDGDFSKFIRTASSDDDDLGARNLVPFSKMGMVRRDR